MVWKEDAQVLFPTVLLPAMVLDKALHYLASMTCQDSSPLTLYFYTSNAESVLRRTNSSQDTPCSSTFLCVHPHLRTEGHSWAFVQNRERHFFLPVDRRLDFRPHSFLGLAHIALTNLVPLLKPGTNTARPPSRPPLIHQVANSNATSSVKSSHCSRCNWFFLLSFLRFLNSLH